jgi:hypothetical protein
MQPAPPPPPQAQAVPPPPPPEPAPSGLPPATQGDAEYGGVDLAAQVAQMNAETEMAPPSVLPESTKSKIGGLFTKIMGKNKGAAAEPSASEPVPSEAPPLPPEGSFTAAASADAAFDAGFPEEEQSDAALADPALVAAAFGETPPKSARKKPLPIVAIGWGILALIVLIVVSLFMFAPSTTVSMLPGAARVYSLFGMPVGASGLAFEGVRYGWTNDGSQTVLEVQGNVRNTSSNNMAVPTVVIALRDEKGEEISEWTTEVGSAELNAGEEAPFLRQIPSPPSNVRSIKVRFTQVK